MAEVPEAKRLAEVERYSLPGHDRDVARAILCQASHGRYGTPLDDIQVAHLMRIGFAAGVRAGREAERAEAIDLITDLVAKATPYGNQDGDFVASYILPTGPIHRAIPWLDARQVYARPGYDPRIARGDNQEAEQHG